jgi:KDO2-lipid IV(A) lauroyltransferase
VSQRLFDLLTGLLARMPMRVGYALADLAGWCHYLFFSARRAAARANVDAMMPDASAAERDRVVRTMMRSYLRMAFEFFRLPRLPVETLLGAIETNWEGVDRALAKGKGLIITCSHIGNWELGAVALAHHGVRVNAVAGVQFGRWLAGSVRDAKAALSVATIAPEDSYRKIWRALARNEAVALMVDGDVFSPGVTCRFFGRDTQWPSGPGTLAMRTGARVAPAYCARVGPGRFRILVEEPLDPHAFASATELNAAIARATEQHIREHLDQWCIFRRMWPASAAPNAETIERGERIRA